MKFKVRFNRRYSFFVTLMACALSVWMMVRNFGLPVEKVYHFGLIIFICLLLILVLAATFGFFLRILANRREQE